MNFLACPPNYYTSGPHLCRPCPRNTVTAPGSLGLSVKSCVCAEGYIGILGEACIGSIFNTLKSILCYVRSIPLPTAAAMKY